MLVVMRHKETWPVYLPVLCRRETPEGQWGLIPVFMRAAELSVLLLENKARKLKKLLIERDPKSDSLRELVVPFLAHHYQEGVAEKMAELFDLNQLLICVDGLDEAAMHRELIERSIDQAVKMKRLGAPLRVLLSTREHSYANSRACLRLGEFGIVKLQPLNKDCQLDMIRRRISAGNIDRFKQQVAATAHRNPKLSTSPFLLSLMIEVYKKHNTIPTQRVDLYAQQVEAIVL